MTKFKRVMGFGTFDALHPGHLFYLNELKKLGDELVVVIARDINVANMKGKAPYHNENKRRQAIIDTEIANLVVLGDERDFLKVIREYSPHILGFGYDQRVNLEDLKAEFPELELVRLKAHKPHTYKSSLIKRAALS